MLAGSKNKTNIGVGIGLAGQIAGRVLLESGSSTTTALAPIVLLAGLAVFVWGCMNYAEGKGHDRNYGYLGLLSLIGLLILVSKPDLHPEKKGAAGAVAPPPPPTANRTAE